MSTEPLLATRDLAIGYSAKPCRRVAKDISVSLAPGELVCLLGPNGAGKSTLLRTLAGMQPPLHGSIRLLGAELERLTPRDLARQLSVVLTDRTDVGALSVYGLVALGRYPHTDWAGRLMPSDRASIEGAMTSVGIDRLASRPVDELSDGERQKVMIARALAQEPILMLLDEPTAFLDLPRRVEIMGILRRLARDRGRSVVLSTHDLDLALRSADRLWLLSPDGTLTTGAPEDLVLNGVFETAFRSDGVEFDPVSGAFRIHQPPSGRIALSGDGLPALWTRRALEREGFQVDSESLASLRVDVLADRGHATWRIQHGEEQFLCQSLYQMITWLRAWTTQSTLEGETP